MSVYRKVSKIGRSMRIAEGRQRNKEQTSDSVPLDLSQDPSQLLNDIFCSLSNKKGISTSRNLSHLNNLIKILCYVDNIDSYYSLDDILICLKPALVSDVKEVRAACIRALRYLINDSHAVALLTKHHLDCLIIKCLDISHFNEVERIQCLRLIRKILHIAKLEQKSHKADSPIIPKSFVACIIAISCDGAEERDRVYRTCLAVLCELVVLEPALVIESGGLLALLKAILECHMYRRINESLCMSLALLLNHPLSRNLSSLEFNFNSLFAPYTDVMYRLHVDIEESQIREEKEMRFLASKMAIVSILHSWPGLVHVGHSSALQAFLSTLSVPNSTNKRAVLSVLYEIFCINEPKWTDNFSEAFESIGPKLFQENWRLTNSFAAAEGKFFLPPNSSPRPDLINCYMAILLSIFIRDDLIHHLVEVVLSSEQHASVGASILLGAILHLCSKLLHNSNDGKPDSEKKSNSDTTSWTYRECLPALMDKATSEKCKRELNLRAGVAIGRLQEIHKFFNKPLAPSSIYLNELLFRVKICKAGRRKSDAETPGYGKLEYLEADDDVCGISENLERTSSIRKNRSLTIVRDFSDEQLISKIKETQVLVAKEHSSWKWEVVSSLLAESFSGGDSAARSLQYVGSDDTVHRFVKRLVNFFLPASGMFCKLEEAREGLDDENRPCAEAGCHLMRFLVTADEEGIKLLHMFIDDVVKHLTKVIEDSDGFKVSNTFLMYCSREYFLLLGAVTMLSKGNDVLKKNKAFELFNQLANDQTHETLIKIVVSSLYYRNDSPSFRFYKKVLVSCNEASRLYSTSYLRVLLRAKAPDFITWGIRLLITQLYDPINKVASEALEILNEACDDPKYLNAVVNLRPSVLHLGEPGALLVCRFMSHPIGFEYLTANQYLSRELRRWWESANELYVARVEELLNLSLTCYERPNAKGGFVRRSGMKKKITPVSLPSHIYGELCRHEKGCKVLQDEEVVQRLMEKLEKGLKSHDEFCNEFINSVFSYASYKKISDFLAKIKSCLWALAHIGSSSYGLDLLRPLGVVRILTVLAQKSPVHSLRGTAFYCLSVISQTVSGTEELRSCGWLSVSRKAMFDTDTASQVISSPVLKSSSWSVSDTRTKAESFASFSRSCSYTPEAAQNEQFQDTASVFSAEADLKVVAERSGETKSKESTGNISTAESVSGDLNSSDNSSLTLPSQMTSDDSDMQGLNEDDSNTFAADAQSKPTSDTRHILDEENDINQKTKDVSLNILDPENVASADTDKQTNKYEHNCKLCSSPGPCHCMLTTANQTSSTPTSPDLSKSTQMSSCYSRSLSHLTSHLDEAQHGREHPGEIVIPLAGDQSDNLSSLSRKNLLMISGDVEMEEPKTDDSWCFNKLLGIPAIETIREQQTRRKLSIYNYGLNDENEDDWSVSVIKDDTRREIEHSICFVGIALPEDLETLFKHPITTPAKACSPISLIPLCVRHKHYFSTQANPFAISSNVETYSSASVQSETTSFLGDVAMAAENASSVVHQEILKLVTNLGSSVGVRMNETALLVMKEKFPDVFDSTSLYYSVSDMLASYKFRITTRRFIQELFHDVALSEVYQEARRVFERKGNVKSGQMKTDK